MKPTEHNMEAYREAVVLYNSGAKMLYNIADLVQLCIKLMILIMDQRE